MEYFLGANLAISMKVTSRMTIAMAGVSLDGVTPLDMWENG